MFCFIEPADAIKAMIWVTKGYEPSLDYHEVTITQVEEYAEDYVNFFYCEN